jgi:hypothetical protein
MLNNDVPIVSKSSELFFGRLHEVTIPEIGGRRLAIRGNRFAICLPGKQVNRKGPKLA